ncbi:unnamed protein product [Rhodiola kirilowii]
MFMLSKPTMRDGPLPFEESGSNSNMYYSFDVAGPHIIMLGSYAEYDANYDQYRWLEADLNKFDRSATPWLIGVLHIVPWYNRNKAHKGKGEETRRAMEEVLYKARVDIVFTRHVHAYERFTTVYDNKADPCGPIHVTIGDGGNKERLAEVFQEVEGSSLSVFKEASFGMAD